MYFLVLNAGMIRAHDIISNQQICRQKAKVFSGFSVPSFAVVNNLICNYFFCKMALYRACCGVEKLCLLVNKHVIQQGVNKRFLKNKFSLD